MEACAHFDQCSYAAAHADSTARGVRDAAYEFEGSRLAGAVWSDDREALSLFDVKREVREGAPASGLWTMAAYSRAKVADTGCQLVAEGRVARSSPRISLADMLERDCFGHA